MRILTAAIFAWCAAATAASAADDPAARYAAAIAEAERNGATMFAHDEAAIAATDFVLSKLSAADKARLAGWVDEATGERRFRVLFFGQGASGPFPIASVETAKGVADAGAYMTYADGEAVPAALLPAIKARQLAARQKFEPCSRAYNTVVAPAGDRGYYVWLLAATTEAGVFPMGGHYRYLVDKAGETVLETTRFTRTCLTLRTPAGGRATDLVVTQVLTPHPTEIHVWASLLNRVPVFVMTGDTTWRVVDGKISVVPDR